MKKFLKIVGLLLLIIIALFVVLIVVKVYLELQQKLKQEKICVEKLRNAGPYEADTVQFHIAQIPDSARAAEVYRYFRLDTLLSPTATTWENATRLARLVADNVPHDNPPKTDEGWPQVHTAIGYWKHNQKRRGLNCRHHSIMLYEMLTAAGIKARFVTCLPEDSTDRDCHVVNHVWLPELRKWAMLDADGFNNGFNYYTDPNSSIPLSLGEMRQRVIDGKPMQLNVDMDKSELKFFSKYTMRPYWSKNLYWFEVHEQHCFGRENDERPDDRLIALIPSGWQAFVKHGQAIKTTDEARFWAAPEE